MVAGEEIMNPSFFIVSLFNLEHFVFKLLMRCNSGGINRHRN